MLTYCAHLPAHLQGSRTGAWSGPQWQRSHYTGGPGCAAPRLLHPSGGGCWTSADLDTQSHSSGRWQPSIQTSLSSQGSRLSDLTINHLRKEPPPLVGSLFFFVYLTFIYSVWGRGCHGTQYRAENKLWERALSFHHGVSRITLEFACLAETTFLTQGLFPSPFQQKAVRYNRNCQEHQGLQRSACPEGAAHSLAKPFTMSRAYWLRSSVTEASRLEIAKGTESTSHQFHALVPVLPSLVSCVMISLPFTSTRPQSHQSHP